MTDPYMCPFCRDVDDCYGPHIKQEDLESYEFRLEYERQSEVVKAAERVMLLPVTDGNLRRNDVIYAIRNDS